MFKDAINKGRAVFGKKGSFKEQSQKQKGDHCGMIERSEVMHESNRGKIMVVELRGKY